MKAILETTGKKINNREHISKETSVNITSSFNSLSEAGTNLSNFDTDSNRIETELLNCNGHIYFAVSGNS